jgi:hypothetical protein
VFAEFGVLNFWTYVVGAFFIVLVPGPNTLFVLKTGIGHGVKKGYLAATACLSAMRSDVSGLGGCRRINPDHAGFV